MYRNIHAKAALAALTVLPVAGIFLYYQMDWHTPIPTRPERISSRAITFIFVVSIFIWIIHYTSAYHNLAATSFRRKLNLFPRYFSVYASYSIPLFCILIFLLPVMYSHTIHQQVNTLFGLIPLKGAAGHFQGAMELLFHGETTSWADKRPLTSAALATTMGIAKLDYASSIYIQAALAGLAAYLLSRVITDQFGMLSGTISFLICFTYIGGTTLSTPMSATPGFIFAALSAASFLLWGRSSSLSPALLGIATLSIAHSIRPGPVSFVLVGILLFLIIYYLKFSRARTRPLLTVLAIILCACTGPMLDSTVRFIHSGQVSLGNSNSSYLLWALVNGRTGWKPHAGDFSRQSSPDITNKTNYMRQGGKPADVNLFVKSWHFFTENPYKILDGFYVRCGAFFSSFEKSLSKHVPLSSSRLHSKYIHATIILVCLIALMLHFRKGNIRTAGLVTVVILSALLSSPILGGVALSRTMSTILPYLALFYAIGLSALTTAHSIRCERTTGSGPIAKRLIAVLPVVLVLALAMGHSIAHSVYGTRSPEFDKQTEDDEHLIYWPPSAPTVLIVKSPSLDGIFNPNAVNVASINLPDMMIPYVEPPQEIKSLLERHGTRVTYPFYPQYHRTLLVLKDEMTPEEPGWHVVHGTIFPVDPANFVLVDKITPVQSTGHEYPKP